MRLLRAVFFLPLFSAVLFVPAHAQSRGGSARGSTRERGFGGSLFGGFIGNRLSSGGSLLGGLITGHLRGGHSSSSFAGGRGREGGQFRGGFAAGAPESVPRPFGFDGVGDRGVPYGPRYYPAYSGSVGYPFGYPSFGPPDYNPYYYPPQLRYGYAPQSGYGPQLGYPRQSAYSGQPRYTPQSDYAFQSTYGQPGYALQYDQPNYGGPTGQPSAWSPPLGRSYSQPRPLARVSFHRVADFYLIAFTDQTVQTAVAYSVEGDTLRWTTRDHLDREAPVSAVDRRFSEQLNRDRGVDFRLP